MDVINQAVWPNASSAQMTPQSLNGQAGDWTDVLMYGLSGAAVNAAYNLSNTVGYEKPTIGISVGTNGNLMPLLVLGVLAYVLLKKD